MYEPITIDRNENNQLSLMEEETKNYLEEMKKGSYNILVTSIKKKFYELKIKKISLNQIIKFYLIKSNDI